MPIGRSVGGVILPDFFVELSHCAWWDVLEKKMVYRQWRSLGINSAAIKWVTRFLSCQSSSFLRISLHGCLEWAVLSVFQLHLVRQKNTIHAQSGNGLLLMGSKMTWLAPNSGAQKRWPQINLVLSSKFKITCNVCC